jgi:hypothetical protein
VLLGALCAMEVDSKAITQSQMKPFTLSKQKDEPKKEAPEIQLKDVESEAVTFDRSDTATFHKYLHILFDFQLAKELHEREDFKKAYKYLKKLVTQNNIVAARLYATDLLEDPIYKELASKNYYQNLLKEARKQLNNTEFLDSSKTLRDSADSSSIMLGLCLLLKVLQQNEDMLALTKARFHQARVAFFCDSKAFPEFGKPFERINANIFQLLNQVIEQNHCPKYKAKAHLLLAVIYFRSNTGPRAQQVKRAQEHLLKATECDNELIRKKAHLYLSYFK